MFYQLSGRPKPRFCKIEACYIFQLLSGLSMIIWIFVSLVGFHFACPWNYFLFNPPCVSRILITVLITYHLKKCSVCPFGEILVGHLCLFLREGGQSLYKATHSVKPPFSWPMLYRNDVKNMMSKYLHLVLFQQKIWVCPCRLYYVQVYTQM